MKITYKETITVDEVNTIRKSMGWRQQHPEQLQEQRDTEKFGERITEGGDMYEQHQKFIEFVASRSLSRIEQWEETLACLVIRADGVADYKQTAADIANRFYTKLGEPWRVYTKAIGELSPYRFVVIFARYQGKWLYAKHKKRNTWETAGGHIEQGETPYEAAKRELYEETGATPFEVVGVFDYAVHTETEFSYGRVLFAEIEKLNELPESEMAETRLFDNIPDTMTYPQKIFSEKQKLQR
jgi:8-oxo-dGTP diphosphatase